ncbi:DUF4331 family protein [Streptomyces sp. MP131-18]|uniref:DUF4331 family protein n=1 Tax=Streptomyces sp. MP131-18 TaxID=1857892 RepID=UPI0009A1D8AB|nr:DUF4331 family protein [Streptomyces sp. MP131-18]ONK13157.1 hypothetical protein STBA_39190 [Streptomyces sp. MP131-18]
MSDHLDGLTASQEPRLDVADFYLFRGHHGTVAIMNVNPVSGGGGFHPEARYEVRFDTDGDVIEDVVLRAEFSGQGVVGRQLLKLWLVAGRGARDPETRGRLIAVGRSGSVIHGERGIRVFAGAAGDPFFIEGSVVAAVRTSLLEGTRLDLSDFDPDTPSNLFGGTNVQALVVELPDRLFGRRTVHAWAAVTVPTDAGGGWRQIDRAGNPLVSTLFGFNSADDFNAAHPRRDLNEYGEVIRALVARAVHVNGTHTDPDAHGERIRDLLLPDVLTYRPGWWVLGHRGGRRLIENSPERMFRLVLNRSLATGLGPDDASGQLRDVFPYVSEPVAPDPETARRIREQVSISPLNPFTTPSLHTHSEP